MHFFPKYSYIWCFPKDQEHAYSQFVLPANLISLRLVTFITLFGMSLFLVIDFFRDVEYSIVLATRAIILTVALIIMGASYRSKLSSGTIQWMIVILTFLNFGSAMVTALFARMPSYYLTNLLFLIEVLVVTATGLHFRNALKLNTACLVLFLIFSQWIKQDPFYVSQYPHLISIFIYIHIIGGVLESRRRLNFLQFTDLTEQKRLVEDLNNQKSKIISILSHDIASPVHSLLGIVNLEKKGQIRPEELPPIMEKIGDELSRVHTLMFSLMRWSKSQMDGFSVVDFLFNLNDLVRENIALFKTKMDSKNIVFNVRESGEQWVKADIEMIRLVLRNLISNAIKFSKPGGEVNVTIKVDSGNVIFEIANMSPPLSEEAHDQLIGFRMMSTPGTLNERGSGLGLALAKHFTELNNGKLTLQPYTASKQIIFCLELPLAKVPVENEMASAEA